MKIQEHALLGTAEAGLCPAVLRGPAGHSVRCTLLPTPGGGARPMDRGPAAKLCIKVEERLAGGAARPAVSQVM